MNPSVISLLHGLTVNASTAQTCLPAVLQHGLLASTRYLTTHATPNIQQKYVEVTTGCSAPSEQSPEQGWSSNSSIVQKPQIQQTPGAADLQQGQQQQQQQQQQQHAGLHDGLSLLHKHAQGHHVWQRSAAAGALRLQPYGSSSNKQPSALHLPLIRRCKGHALATPPCMCTGSSRSCCTLQPSMLPLDTYSHLSRAYSSSRHVATFSGSSSSSDGSGSSRSHPATATWVDKYLPVAAQPYAHLMRLDKPIGSWLLAWPGLWSIALAAPPGHLPDWWLTTLFGTGAVLMRGAGCTINDLWDKDIDKQVDRTKTRPLAAGTISQTAALAFLAAQLSLSLGILLQLNLYTQVLGVCSLALVATYPLMKRITWWPQAFLGLCMNYGVLMGWSAAAGSCDWSVVLPMYAAGVSWTLVYDTIYAHQDKKDDATVGVKSTALLFGDRTKEWSVGFAVVQTLGLGLAGQAAGCGVAYYAAVAAGAAHQAWQISSVDLNNGPDCMAKFVSNKWYGAIVYAGIAADRVLAVFV